MFEHDLFRKPVPTFRDHALKPDSNGTTVDRSLIIRNLWKEYRVGQPVLKDVSFTVAPRGMTAIIGPSGTGKSSLIRCINRLIDPTAGEIRFLGQDIAKLKGTELRQARRRIGMVFQEYNLVERLTVIENVLTGRLGYVAVWRAWLRKFPPADIDRAFQLLDAVGLSELATQRADQLSGGQRQRVGIARALMQEPDLLLADEPTSSLDPKTSVEIMELIARRAGEHDIPVIVNIHNVGLARRFAGRIIGMSKGEIVFDGPPRALEDEHLLKIYGGEGWLE
jgi:phosphonate transport system ATP-binding protein